MTGLAVVMLFIEVCLAGVWLLWPWRNYREQRARVQPNVRQLLGWRVAGLEAMMLCLVPPLALWPQPLWAAVMLGISVAGGLTVVVATLALHTLQSTK